jgi:hypothetical protein
MEDQKGSINTEKTSYFFHVRLVPRCFDWRTGLIKRSFLKFMTYILFALIPDA